MLCICEFDPIRDIQAVDPTGGLDLAKAHAMSSVPANIAAEELQYNDIDDPRSIGGRPSDSFEAVQMSKSVLSYKAPKKDGE